VRFSRAQYEAAIAALRLGSRQLAPEANCCAICGDSGHLAWECGHNPLLAMAVCERIAKDSEQLHATLHVLAGYDSHLGVQRGPARIVLPEGEHGAK
jgi:hypothetical protein